MHNFNDFNECANNQPTDRPTDTAYYRDARTHLKTHQVGIVAQRKQLFNVAIGYDNKLF